MKYARPWKNERLNIIRELGSGSLCQVLEVEDLTTGAHLALKLLIPNLEQSRPVNQAVVEVSEKMQNAFAYAQSIHHPHVINTFEFINDGDSVGYTMELASAGSLADRMSIGPPVPIPEAVGLLRQLSLGMHGVHEAGFTHRNIKPENILLFDDGTLKISDFFTACGKDGHRSEEHGTVVGSIDYLAPEYMLRSHVDWRSDLYGFGVIAYELVTGGSPFVGDSVYATMTRRLKSDPAAPSTIRCDCPSRLDEIILRSMNRDPLERYQSAAEIARDLEALL